MAKPSISPRRWTPPPAPERARRTSSTVPLPPLEVLPVPGRGPEDVCVLPGGDVVTGLADGQLVRVRPGGDVAVVADTGGRPLGVEVLDDGRLLVCDARRGLLRVDPAGGHVEPVLTAIGGEPMRFCNNAAVQADGTVWFTDSSRRFGIDQWRADLVEHSATGRLVRLSADGGVDVVLDGLAFANGVACAPDGSWVVVAETGGYTLTRVDGGTGAAEVVVASLPGLPDNVARGSDGLVWVALPSPRSPQLDALLPRSPLIRQAVWRLPERLQPSWVDTVWVQAYTPDGRLVHDLQGSHPGMRMVTGVREDAGTVWLGSLVGRAVARFTRPEPAPGPA